MHPAAPAAPLSQPLPRSRRISRAVRFGALTLLYAVCFFGAMTVAAPSAAILDAQARASAGQPQLLPLLVLMILSTLAVTYPLRRAVVGGWRLAMAIGIAFYGLITFMSQIETAYFRSAFPLIDEAEMVKLFVRGALTTLAFVPVAVGWYARGGPAVRTSRSLFADVPWRIWARRLPLLAVSYVVLYLLFGYFIAYQVADLREFYSGSRAPVGFVEQLGHAFTDDPWFIPFQLLRGVLWVGLAVPVLLVLRDRRASAITLSLMLAAFGAQLLIPNAFFPTTVRLAHFVETTSSTVLFGVLVAYLLPLRGPQAANR